jgi:hypothetical protein
MMNPTTLVIAALVVVAAAYVLYKKETFDTYGNYRVASEIVTGKKWPYGRYALAERDRMGNDIYDFLAGSTLYPHPLKYREPGYMYGAPDSYSVNPGLTVNDVVVELNQGY